MVFDSFDFALFLAAVWPAYLMLGHRGQNRLLLLASWFFYGLWSWKFLALLLATNVVDYWCGRGLAATTRPAARRALVAATIVANMGALAYFKYANFFSANLHALLGAVGIDIPLPVLDVVLPFGISFYTFQEMTYVLDVYRGHVKPARRFSDFALFVTFFPHLVAGPIMRADKLLPQVLSPRTVTAAQVRDGGWLIALGLWKKMFVANTLGAMADPVFANPGAHSGPALLAAAYAFAFQLYGDFSGYSDCAKGVAKLFGFEVTWNFNLPYFAKSPAEFWRRWHISLSEFLRDNVYIPLGGNRAGRAAEFRNLMATMALGGLWHGAAWHYVWWGVYHGALLAAGRAWAMTRGSGAPKTDWPAAIEHGAGGVTIPRPAASGPRLECGAGILPASTDGPRGRGRQDACPTRFASVLKMAAMFHLTVFGWILFRAPDMVSFATYVRRLATAWDPAAFAAAGPAFVTLLAAAGPLAAYEFWIFRRGDLMAMRAAPAAVRAAVYLGIWFSLTLAAPTTARLFFYFQF